MTKAMQRRAIVASLAMTACGGSFEANASDGGPGAEVVVAVDASPTTGCYDAAAGMLACGSFVGRWCWAKPEGGSPGPGCVISPQSSPAAFSYWCCP